MKALIRYPETYSIIKMTRKNHKYFANIDLNKYSVVDKRLLLQYENNVRNLWGFFHKQARISKYIQTSRLQRVDKVRIRNENLPHFQNFVQCRLHR